MAFSPRGEWTEDAPFASGDDVQYNNAVLEDERVGGSETADSSGNESHDLNQDVDYRGLERVIAVQQRRSDGMRPGSGSHREGARDRRSGTQAGRRRSVAGVRLFTSGTAAASGSFTSDGFGGQGGRGAATAVPDCSRVEDITAVGSQASPSAFTPVVPAPSSPISPPSTQPQPSIRRPRIPKKTGNWSDIQLRDAMAAVDGAEVGDCMEEEARIASIDTAEGGPESITRFLTLPTITARAFSRRRDPLLDFTKSKILTSDEYAAVVARLQDAKESGAREKERLRTERDATRLRKAAEKEARAVELAEARARRLEEKEEAVRLRAVRAAEVASARAAKAAEKACRSSRRGGAATEVAQGHQVDTEEAEPVEENSEPQAPEQGFSFDAGGIANPYFSYTPASQGMQYPYFLPLNQLGNHVLTMSPNPHPQPILQPPSLQHASPNFFPQGWKPTEGGRGEGRNRDGGREVRAGRSR